MTGVNPSTSLCRLRCFRCRQDGRGSTSRSIPIRQLPHCGHLHPHINNRGRTVVADVIPNPPLTRTNRRGNLYDGLDIASAA
jgi:hypothetical protein